MTPVDEAAFPALARKISAGVGLALDNYKDKCVRRRIAVRMRACGVQTYADYGAVLDRVPDELERLRDALTINVTRFYRNADTWDALGATVIPELCACEPGPLRVWSAGCASGEEAYTLAMLFAEHLNGARARGTSGDLRDLARLTIDATDIDRLSLTRAAAGRYPSSAFVELPAPYAARYFDVVEGDYVMRAPLRQRVEVAQHDLIRHPPPRRNYHLILCRNVVIYFDRAVQERLFRRFADALAPGGYLVLGKVETLFGPAREGLTVVDPRERIFRRAP